MDVVEPALRGTTDIVADDCRFIRTKRLQMCPIVSGISSDLIFRAGLFGVVGKQFSMANAYPFFWDQACDGLPSALRPASTLCQCQRAIGFKNSRRRNRKSNARQPKSRLAIALLSVLGSENEVGWKVVGETTVAGDFSEAMARPQR